MMDKLLWPAHLSADYTLENMSGLTTRLRWPPGRCGCVAGLAGVQKSNGRIGVAIYWLGLVTVSNFTPLNRILADRFIICP